ncbi:MAG: nitroreductase family protein [Methylotenera sp.]
MQLPKLEMTIFEAILARRSVRSYKAQQVDIGTIRTLLEAAVRAPTAIHQESWGFVVIQDRPLLLKLSDQAKPLFLAEVNQHAQEHSKHLSEIFDKPDFNIFYDANTLILICGKTSASFYEADCWLAAENLMLAACAMGLGTCVIGSALPALNMPEVKVKLNIPDYYSVVAPIILGYPANETAPVVRKTPVVLARFPTAASGQLS